MATPENDDEMRTVRVSGRQAKLPGGRAVFVGWSKDGKTVLRFTNNRGTERSILLSKDAADALKILLNDGPEKVGTWLVVVELDGAAAQGIEAGTVETSEAQAPCEARDPDGEADAPGESTDEH